MKTEISKMAIMAFTAFLVGVAVPVMAEEGPSTEFSASLLSQYIWRGQELSKDSMVVQPSATVSLSGFSFNWWANWDTDVYDGRPVNLADKDNLNETDLTFAYVHDFGIVSAGAGYIYYALDQAEDSQEFYVAATLNVLLSPTLTVYREFAHYPSTYIELAVSHSFALPYDVSLDVSLSGSYLDSDDSDAYPDPDHPDDDYSNLHDGRAGVSMTIPFSAFLSTGFARYFSITPEVNYVFPLSGDASGDMADRALGNTRHNNFVYGGATFSFSF